LLFYAAALRQIAVGLGCGLTVATIWGLATRNEHKKWDMLNKVSPAALQSI
jgi:hypothetical protein